MAALLLLHRTWPISIFVGIGTTLLALLSGLMLHAHLKAIHLEPALRAKVDRLVWFTALLSVGGTQIANITMGQETHSPAGLLLMAPLVAQAMLVAALSTPGVSIVGLSMSVLLLGIAGGLPVELAAGTWLAGAVAAHVVNPLKQRSDLIRAMSVQVVAQSIICISMTFLMPQLTVAGWEAAIWGSIAAVIATAIFWLGVAIFEKIFGIVSDWTLLELCSPEQPLIRELVLRAPGTYAHSVGVGNIAEAAAREVGANPLLCRTMAYYHDIGKTARPNYFIENQIGENIHDDLSPSLSAQIIAAHVSDGVEMAKKQRLPQVIIDGIAEHHGTSLITYFYHRAVEQKGLEPNQEAEKKFRYPGPKPQTKETAILHLADVIEASSRVALRDQSLDLFVAKVVEKARADGQLDESDLTFKDLGIISESFCRTLRALRHERVQYPTESTANLIGAQVELDEGGLAPENTLSRDRGESTSEAQGL
ncbi:MAG: HDIG domain-containing metalloprotein [Fimbriimonadaceae bacterium]